MTPGAPAALHPRRLLAALVLLFAALAGSAMLRTSATFDEIVFMSVGARALETGDYSMVDDHPRLPQYLFGIPAHLVADHYPPEDGRWSWISRYHYSRAFLWGVGNHPERIIMVARLVGLAFGIAMVLGVFFFSRRHLGEGGALFAAALTAFVPDVLAHSGVAYNDVPLAFAFLAGVYVIDAAVRRPTVGRVAEAALVFAFAACIKYSGLILGPVLVVLVALEALSGRARDRQWVRAIARGVPVFVVVAWAAITLLYLGDWGLRDYVAGIRSLLHTSSEGRPAFLFGHSNFGGWWYFFPVAFLLKTPFGLHALMLVALGSAFFAAKRSGAARQWMTHGARAPAAGAAVFLAVVFFSGFNIGVRHVMPMMPLLCILVAQGATYAWTHGQRAMQAAVALAFVAFVASSLTAYPYFFGYLSEFAWGRGPAETLVDSNTDWGQGLLALRDFMRAHHQDRVALAYFGSALPEGYGIQYVPLRSFLDLPEQPQPDRFPRYIVISATLLSGNYLTGDPYAKLRLAKPVAILAGSLYVFDGGRR